MTKKKKVNVDPAHPTCLLSSLRETENLRRKNLNNEHSKEDAYQALPQISLRDIAGNVKYRRKGGKLSCMSVAGVWRIEKGGEVTLGVARALAGYFGKSVCEVWPEMQ